MNNNQALTLILTHSCNLKCTYCYEHHKSTNCMTWETAKKILEKELKNQATTIKLELLGGEPFLQFELIKKIVNYVKEKDILNIQLSTTTNGTLVHGEIQGWLKENLHNFKVYLSLDGTKLMHNLNRDNSFDLIDLDFFSNYFSDCPIKMTISQDTLPNLAEGIIFCHEKGFKVNCNLAYGIDWNKNENEALLEQQLKNLIEFYLLHPNISVCSLLSEPLEKISLYNIKPLRTCGAGYSMVAYDCNGESYPCQFFAPMSIGEQKAAESKTIKFPNDEIPNEELDLRCRDCILLPQCHICYGANYATTGSIYHHDEYWCKLNKIIFRARAYYYSRLYEEGKLHMSEKQKYHTLRSIMLIQKFLK